MAEAKYRKYKPSCGWALLFPWLACLLLFYACVATTTNQVNQGSGEIDSASKTPVIEDILSQQAQRLAQNREELGAIRGELDGIGAQYPFMPGDDQIGYVQKASLHISRSILTARHQEEMLALATRMDKKQTPQQDALMAESMGRAVTVSTQDTTYLITSETFLENRDAAAQIRKALTVIQDNLECYRELIDLFAPPEEEDHAIEKETSSE